MSDQQVAAGDVGASFVVRFRPDVSSLELDDEVLVLDAACGRTVLLHGTAAVTWRCFDGVSAVGAIGGDLADAYGAPAEIVTDDVLSLVRQLGAVGMVEGIEPALPAPAESPPSLEVGTALPDIAVENVAGRPVGTLDLAGRRAVVVNWNPGCGWCRRLAPDLAALHPAMASDGVLLALVATGGADANRELLDEYGLSPDVVMLLDGHENTIFGMAGTPVAYAVDDARTTAPMAVGKPSVEELVRSQLTS